MRAVVFLALVVAAPALAEPPKAPRKLADHEAIVGVWTLASISSEMGEVTGEQLTRYKLAFTGRTYMVSTDQPVSGGYTVDPTTRVKALDLDAADGPNKGKTTRCIYELDGDTLRICQGQAGSDRPAGFPDKPAQGLVILVFKRLAP